MSEHKNGATDLIQQSKGTKFSFYIKPIKNTEPGKSVTLEDALFKIVGDEYKDSTATARGLNENDYRRFKATKFDYVTFNGTFSNRSDNGLIEPSGLFVIDVDHLPPQKLNDLFDRLKIDSVLGIKLMFISPGGDGLKIVVGIDFSLIDITRQSNKMEVYWQAVNSYFKQHFSDLITPNERDHYIDAACKDLSRACFLCHDANAYENIKSNVVLGQSFINDYPPTQAAKKSEGKKTESGGKKNYKVSLSTSLDKLAKKHLIGEIHHPELISFTGAAATAGHPKEQTRQYIRNHVKVSKDSTHSDSKTIDYLVSDIYGRYSSDSNDVVRLNELTFTYKILYFKYDRPNKIYIANSLVRNEVLNILEKAGFAKRKINNKGDFIYIKNIDCVISEVTPEIMKDYFNVYVTQIEKNMSFTYQGIVYEIPPAQVRETFLRNSNNIFNHAWLQHLKEHNDPIIKDTQTEMYFFFKNDLVTVTRKGAKKENWRDKKGMCIWEEQIIPHDINILQDCEASIFYTFLKNVTKNDEGRMKTMSSGIGYLLHHYFNESEGQAVVLYDETVTDINTPQGGSGKGVIIKAIKQMRNVVKIDGKNLNPDGVFKWDKVNHSSQVVWVDDVKPTFDFSMLHSNLTDGWDIQVKNKTSFTIEPANSPKTVICSNSIINGGGTTNARRQHVIELSDFYSSQIIKGNEKPIEETHGCIFFKDSEKWNTNEWDLFFSNMFECGAMYLEAGLINSGGVNVEMNRFRQSTDEDFTEWIETLNFTTGVRYDTRTYHEEYIKLYCGDNYPLSQKKFTEWLKKYAIYKNWKFVIKPSNGIAKFIFNKK